MQLIIVATMMMMKLMMNTLSEQVNGKRVNVPAGLYMEEGCMGWVAWGGRDRGAYVRGCLGEGKINEFKMMRLRR